MIHNRTLIFGLSFTLFALMGVVAFPQQVLAQNTVISPSVSDNENDFVPGQIIVGLTNNPNDVKSDIQSKGGKILDENDKLNALLVKVPNNAEDAFLEAIKNNPNVSFAAKNHIVKKTALIPNDPYWDDQWNMKIIKTHEAWSTQLGSAEVIVAVADTGVDYTHDDLAGRIILGPDYANNDADPMDGDGHGTHVAGTVGATTNNGIGVAGIAKISVLAIKVLDDNGSGSDWTVSKGITYAETNADIINLSLGCICLPSDLPLTQSALNSAYSNDVLIVAAAGNDASNGPHYPSDDPNVISVSATTKDDTLASYSNFGNSVELSAPGGDTKGGPYWKTYVLSTYPGNSYAYSVGTSMASPHVAGVAALVLSQDPNLSNTELREHLQNTADDLGSSGVDPLYGYGRVNAQTAVETIPSSPTPNNPPIADANGPYTATEDMVIVFDGSGSSDPDSDELTYSWDFGDGTTGTGITPSHSYDWGGTFSVTLTVSDGIDTNSDISSATISEINDVPIADANGPYSSTVDEVITLDGSGSFDPDNQDGTTSNDQTLTYSWDFGDGTTGTGITPSHIYSMPGTFDVTLVVNDGIVDSAMATTSVTVNEPSLDVSVGSIIPDSVQAGSSVDVVITGTNFVQESQVSLTGGSGPISVSNVQFVDETTIKATIITKDGGPPRDRVWDVTVTNPDGTSGMLSEGFTVTVVSNQNGNSKAK